MHEVIELPNGVAVVADNYWLATKARQALSVTWDDTEFADISTNSLHQKFIEQLTTTGKTLTDKGQTEQKLTQYQENSPASILQTNFQFSPVAHMTMEPMNCTVLFSGDSCEIWAPTQNPQDARKSAAETLGLALDKVMVHVTYMGGGFGRRAQDDFVVEACQIAKKSRFPLKVMWSREDDIQHDFYRPPNNQQIRATLKDGRIDAWQHKIATLSTSPYHFSLEERGTESGDWVAYGGINHALYQIEHFQTQVHLTKTPITVGILRGISHGYVHFAIETTIDQLAILANKDAIAFRKQHITEKRPLTVLALLEEKVNALSLKPNQFLGVAFGHEKGGDGPYQYYNAAAAVVSFEQGKLSVDKVLMVLDHGQVINPDGLLAQTQGAVVFAMGVMFGQPITINKGRTMQSNFHDYPVPRINESVDVELFTTGNHDWPMGMGEKLQGTIQPAIANAIYAATGTRISSIPTNLNDIAQHIVTEKQHA